MPEPTAPAGRARTRVPWLLALAALLGACATPTTPPPPLVARTLFVVRHPEAHSDVASLPGQADALTARGESQAVALGQQLAGRGATHLFGAPAARTSRTAELIGQVLDLRPASAPALAALGSGDVPWPRRLADWTAGRDPRPDDGESMADGVRRALALVRSVPRDAVAVLVTHGDLAAGLIGHARQLPAPERWARCEPPVGSVTVLRVDDEGRWSLQEQWVP